MTDSWLENHQDTMADTLSRFERNQLSATDCIQKFGITCDSPIDSWTKHFLKQEAYAKDIGDRLDYIFYRRTPEINCQESKVVMDDYIPGTQWSYSDHFGVHSLFTIAGQSNRAIGNFAPVPSQLARPDFSNLLPSTLDTAIDILELEHALAITTANGHLALFIMSIIIAFGLYIVQITVPAIYHDNIDAVLLSTIICGFLMIVFSAVAIVSLVVGFVFGRMEQRSLSQYIIDFRVSLETLQQQSNIPRKSFISTTTTTTTNSVKNCLATTSLSSSYSSSSNSEGLIVKK